MKSKHEEEKEENYWAFVKNHICMPQGGAMADDNANDDSWAAAAGNDRDRGPWNSPSLSGQTSCYEFVASFPVFTVEVDVCMRWDAFFFLLIGRRYNV